MEELDEQLTEQLADENTGKTDEVDLSSNYYMRYRQNFYSLTVEEHKQAALRLANGHERKHAVEGNRIMEQNPLSASAVAVV